MSGFGSACWVSRTNPRAAGTDRPSMPGRAQCGWANCFLNQVDMVMLHTMSERHLVCSRGYGRGRRVSASPSAIPPEDKQKRKCLKDTSLHQHRNNIQNCKIATFEIATRCRHRHISLTRLPWVWSRRCASRRRDHTHGYTRDAFQAWSATIPRSNFES